jgi:hypothetical protein
MMSRSTAPPAAADSRRLLAARSAWAILALASGDDRFAARVAAGLSRPEVSRARARLEGEGLLALLPLLTARAGRAWCTTVAPTAVAQLRSDPRLVVSGDIEDARVLSQSMISSLNANMAGSPPVWINTAVLC